MSEAELGAEAKVRQSYLLKQGSFQGKEVGLSLGSETVVVLGTHQRLAK